MSETKNPLAGIKVVDLSTYIAGPCCARYLADLGAEVIKVESSDGDPLRYTAINEGRPYGDMEDTSITLENAGKKCVIFNLKTQKGQEAFHKLLADSQIFVTNWRPRALERAGLDYASLKEKYPALVMGLVSGYGENGPDKDLPGFDFTAFFARGGVLGTLYDRDSLPMFPLAGFGDHQVGLYLAGGILAALYRARETGFGDQVIVSLLHTAIWDVSLILQGNQYGKPATQYPISRSEVANQFLLAFRAKDGKWVQLAAPLYNKSYPLFMQVIDRQDLIDDPRFFPQANVQNNLKEFHELITDTFLQKTSAEWSDLLTNADIPFAVCQTWDTLLKDPQAWDSNCFAEVEFPSGQKRTMVRPPVQFTETPLPAYERAAFLGENTEEVLRKLGYSEEQIVAMIEAGDAVGCKRIG